MRVETETGIRRGLAVRRALLPLVALLAASVLSLPPARAGASPVHGLGAIPPTTSVAPTAAAPMAARAASLPSSVDLTSWAVPVGDQGTVGSCVAWTIGHDLMGWYARKAGQSESDFAPMYIYSQTNTGRDASPAYDGGSYPSDALDLVVAQGDDTESDYTQGNYDWSTQPTEAQRANAAQYKISGYRSLFAGAAGAPGVAAVKDALAAGQPVAIEIPIRPGFADLSPTNTLDTDDTGAIQGYHEILALGYDSTGLLIQNHWGTGWGSAGYGRLAWNVVGSDVVEADVLTG